MRLPCRLHGAHTYTRPRPREKRDDVLESGTANHATPFCPPSHRCTHNHHCLCVFDYAGLSLNKSRLVFPCQIFPSLTICRLQVLNTRISDHRGSNYSGGVRQYIQGHLSRREGYRITGVRSDTYVTDMKNSKFCLAPEGASPTRHCALQSTIRACSRLRVAHIRRTVACPYSRC